MDNNSMEARISYDNESAAAEVVARGDYGILKYTRENRIGDGVDEITQSIEGVFTTPKEAEQAVKQLNDEQGKHDIQAPYGHPLIKPYETEDFVHEDIVRFSLGKLSVQGTDVIVSSLEKQTD